LSRLGFPPADGLSEDGRASAGPGGREHLLPRAADPRPSCPDGRLQESLPLAAEACGRSEGVSACCAGREHRATSERVIVAAGTPVKY